MDKLIRLSDFFHISIDELVGRETPKPASEEAEPEQAQTDREIHYVPYHWHYEYKSRRSLFGLPLVHINIGRWIPGQKLYRARGVLAIGSAASGIFALGALSAGIFSIGALSVGCIAIGGFAFGIFAVGGVAHAPVAIGDAANGESVFDINSHIAPDVIRHAILERFPKTWDIIVQLFSTAVSR